MPLNMWEQMGSIKGRHSTTKPLVKYTRNNVYTYNTELLTQILAPTPPILENSDLNTHDPPSRSGILRLQFDKLSKIYEKYRPFMESKWIVEKNQNI